MPMWTWMVGGMFVLLMVLRAARRSFRRMVRQEVRALLAARHPEWPVTGETDDALLLKMDAKADAITFNLYNLYTQASNMRPNTPEARVPVYEKFLGALEEGLASQTPTMEKHGEHLLPRLVGDAFLRQGGPLKELVKSALQGTPLHVVYVVDGKHGVAYITDDKLKSLGITAEALHARALDNLRKRMPAEMVKGAVSGGIQMSKEQDTFDAARLLLVPEQLGEGETLAAVIPDRDTLGLMPVPTDGNWKEIDRLARTAAGTTLLDVPLKVTRAGFEKVTA